VQFAPKLKSAGGKFDPDEWVQLFVDTGARFGAPVAEHHDGFSMGDSQVNEWNSVKKGPVLDLLRVFATAIPAKGLKLLVAMHHAYHFNGFYEFAPAQTDPSLKKLYGQLRSAAENQLWHDKLKEVVDRAQPDILWQDFKLDAVAETQRLNFLSYCYNQAVSWGREVVAICEDGMNGKQCTPACGAHRLAGARTAPLADTRGRATGVHTRRGAHQDHGAMCRPRCTPLPRRACAHGVAHARSGAHGAGRHPYGHAHRRVGGHTAPRAVAEALIRSRG
jgi:hypothetical protein